MKKRQKKLTLKECVMSSRGLDVLFIVLAFYLCFQVKKISFISDDCFDLILNVSNTGLLNKSYICSSIWMNKVNNMLFASKRSINSYICLLMLTCGDVERLPGPPSNLDLLFRKKRFSLLHQNLRGLFKNFYLVSDLLENNNTIDILTLSETHIRPTDEVSVLNVTGYIFLSLARKAGSGGGIGLYISNHDFKYHEDLEKTSLESIWIEILPQILSPPTP